MAKEMQIRDLKATNLQIREEENGKRVIEGLIPYNSRSEWMGFYEFITPTAFNKTIADGADVRALMGHDSNRLLGRVKNGSLRLRSEEDGLHIECDLPQTSYAEDAYELIKGGYNRGLSFGFRTVQDKWEEMEEDGRMVPVCHLIEVRLFEVSFCVTFPAYEATTSEARSVRSLLDEIRNLDLETLSEEERKEYETTSRELAGDAKPVAELDTSADELTEAEKRFDQQLDELLNSLKTKEY